MQLRGYDNSKKEVSVLSLCPDMEQLAWSYHKSPGVQTNSDHFNVNQPTLTSTRCEDAGMQSLHEVVLIYRIHDIHFLLSNSSYYVSVSPDAHTVYNNLWYVVPALKEYNNYYYAK